jgi:hypothetical protein
MSVPLFQSSWEVRDDLESCSDKHSRLGHTPCNRLVYADNRVRRHDRVVRVRVVTTQTRIQRQERAMLDVVDSGVKRACDGLCRNAVA